MPENNDHAITAESIAQQRGTVENKAAKPAGLLPKNTQQLVILGVAVVMVLIMWLSGGRKHPIAAPGSAPPAARVQPPNPATVEDFKETIQQQQAATRHTIIYFTQVIGFVILSLHGRKPQSRFDLSESANDGFRPSSKSCFTLRTRLRSGTFSSGLPVLRFFFLRGPFMALLEMLQKYSTDEKCREILTKLRWPEGVRCPRCKEDRVCWLDSRKQFECASCSYQFSVTTGTIFNDTHLPLEKWFAATYLLCESKKGMSACQVQRTIGVSYKTAWYLCHRIRAAMADVDKPMLDGTVEMDETYVGGVKHNVGRGPHGSEKEIVVGIRQRGGDLRFYHVKNIKSKTLAKYLQSSVSVDVDRIITDDGVAYPKAMIEAGIHKDQHKTINHSHKVYVIGDIHTNTIENGFSLFKRGIMGSWHHISAKHLAAYLEEMEFRFNRRKNGNLFLDTLRHMVTAPVLTFERLTA